MAAGDYFRLLSEIASSACFVISASNIKVNQILVMPQCKELGIMRDSLF